MDYRTADRPGICTRGTAWPGFCSAGWPTARQAHRRTNTYAASCDRRAHAASSTTSRSIRIARPRRRRCAPSSASGHRGPRRPARRRFVADGIRVEHRSQPPLSCLRGRAAAEPTAHDLGPWFALRDAPTRRRTPRGGAGTPDCCGPMAAQSPPSPHTCASPGGHRTPIARSAGTLVVAVPDRRIGFMRSFDVLAPHGLDVALVEAGWSAESAPTGPACPRRPCCAPTWRSPRRSASPVPARR
jgi:hypothetical protein